MSLLVAVGAVSSAAAPGNVRSPSATAASFLGPLNSKVETATTNWGRDGGISVPLGGGRAFWVFGDTPRYQFIGGHWKLNKFVYGNSAGNVWYVTGKRPQPFNEIVPRHPNKPTNQPT